MGSLGFDYHPTPSWLVERAVSYLTGSPSLLLDPAAGDGRLLREASRRFPSAQCLALDIDARQVRYIESVEGTWSVEQVDFLSWVPRSRVSGASVLLNPPFSGRGAKTWTVDFRGHTFEVSRAMAFFMRSADLVGSSGEVVGLLPRGVVMSERDASAFALLQEHGAIRIDDLGVERVFDTSTASIAVVHWRGGVTSESEPAVRNTEDRNHGEVWLTRGSLPVHRALSRSSNEGVRFIHTWEFSGSDARKRVSRVRGDTKDRLMTSPCVIVPRVGCFSPQRLLILEGEPFVLSDCLFGLEVQTYSDAERLVGNLVAQWDALAKEVGGSCAPYLTRKRLESSLRSLGWNSFEGPRSTACSTQSVGHGEASSLMSTQLGA